MFALAAVYLSVPVVTAHAEEAKTFDDVLSSLINALDGEELDGKMEEIWEKFGKGDLSFEEKIMSVINGDFALDYSNVFSALGNMLFSGVRSLVPVLMAVCAVALLYSFVKTLNPEFLSEGTGRAVYFVCYAVILGLLAYKTFDVVKGCFDGIKRFASVMEIVFPLIITVMTATGATVSASVYRPAVAFLGAGITNAVTVAVIPLVTFLIVFTCVSGLSETLKTNKLAAFVASVIKWILGISATVFTMFLSVQGMTAASYDGITFRITKYVVGNSVPLVGGFLKDGAELFIASGILIKNALGIFGLIAVIGAILAPLARLVAFSLFLRLAAGVVEPFTDSRISDCMASLAKDLNYVLAASLTVGFMYVITIVLLICTGGALI